MTEPAHEVIHVRDVVGSQQRRCFAKIHDSCNELVPMYTVLGCDPSQHFANLIKMYRSGCTDKR
jgi:hypothetical protein